MNNVFKTGGKMSKEKAISIPQEEVLKEILAELKAIHKHLNPPEDIDAHIEQISP